MTFGLLESLLMLSMATSQKTFPHDNIGWKNAQSFELVGKPKKLEECEVIAKDCYTYEFNRYGIELNYLKARKLVNSKDGLLFEVFDSDTFRTEMELYSKNKLVQRWSPGEGELKVGLTYFEYNPTGKLIKERGVIATEDQEIPFYTKTYQYKNNKLSVSFFRDAQKTYNETTIYYNAFQLPEKEIQQKSANPKDITTTTYKYKYDVKKNWIKKYTNGKLTHTRKITYHP